MKIWSFISKWANVIAVVVIMVSLVTIAWMMFRASGKIDINYQAVIKEMDNTRTAIQNERKAYQSSIDEKMSELVTLKQLDSALSTFSKGQQIIYKKLDEKLEKIPIHIAAIADSDSAIIAAYNNFR